MIFSDIQIDKLMRIIYLFLIVIFLILPGSLVYGELYRIYFKDKGPEQFTPGNDIYNLAAENISEKALQRRSKVLPEDSLLTLRDAPVYSGYISYLTENGFEIIQKSRWFNYSVIEADSSDSLAISDFAFVRKVENVRDKLLKSEPLDRESAEKDEDYFSKLLVNCGKLEYGFSWNQNNIINLPAVHSLGITGEGVLIGFLDTGFKTDEHECFKNTAIKATYDFINSDTSVFSEVNEDFKQNVHGTSVFSMCAGYDPGFLIGASFNSRFMLAKTEDISSETHLEEDNYIAAVEWMEAAGCDIITSSLGYKNFDSLHASYDFEDMTGDSLLMEVCVNEAVRLGVICFSSAGNNGPNPETIRAPSSADSCIAVGGIKIDSAMQLSVANFSSRGPNGDGDIKPDISVLAQPVIGAKAASASQYGFSNGTSNASPVAAGGAALILSAFPELRPWEMRNLLYSSADNSNNPDNVTGYGIPDIFKALRSAGIVISPAVTYNNKGMKRIFVYILSEHSLFDKYISIEFSDGSIKDYPLKESFESGLYDTAVPLDDFGAGDAEFFIFAENRNSERRKPYYEPDMIHLPLEEDIFPCGIDQSKFPRLAEKGSDIFFSPSIIMNVEKSIRLNFILNQPGNADIRIYNTQGKVVLSASITGNSAGFYEKYFDISRLASGVYYAVINANNDISNASFIILN